MRARPSLISIWIIRFLVVLVVASGLIPAAVASPRAASSSVGENVGIQEHLGAQLSIDQLRFTDESGHVVPLSTYFHRGKPVIMAMVYYECPDLCTFVLNGLTDSLRSVRKTLGWTAGDRFDIVVVSINPHETSRLASMKKAAYVESYGRGSAGAPSAAGWHFLTGEESQIRELASQIGFNYTPYREGGRETRFAHSSAVYVLSPGGKIARYLYGIEYRPRDLRLALLDASNGRIGTALDRVFSLCYHYDPRTRHYVAAPDRLIEVGAGAGGFGTVLFLGGFLAVLAPRREKQRREEEKERD